MSEWHGGTKVAIFGARSGSLGAAIEVMIDGDGWVDRQCTTFGPGRNRDGDLLHDMLWEWPLTSDGTTPYADLMPYDNVVVTTGLNLPDDADYLGIKQMGVNYHAVMALALQWRSLGKDGHFAVISSNSAHVARSLSVGYCASKAALSQGIRSLARGAQRGPFYAWEFGLLEGTPMTADTVRMVGPDVPLTRMRGLPNGIPLDLAAGHVYRALRYGWKELNGCTLRIDAGEQ